MVYSKTCARRSKIEQGARGVEGVATVSADDGQTKCVRACRDDSQAVALLEL